MYHHNNLKAIYSYFNFIALLLVKSEEKRRLARTFSKRSGTASLQPDVLYTVWNYQGFHVSASPFTVDKKLKEKHVAKFCSYQTLYTDSNNIARHKGNKISHLVIRYAILFLSLIKLVCSQSMARSYHSTFFKNKGFSNTWSLEIFRKRWVIWSRTVSFQKL